MALPKLSSVERDLVMLRDELYGGSWDAMLSDLKSRLEGKPYVFKLARRIEEDVRLMEELREIEKNEGVNLAEHL